MGGNEQVKLVFVLRHKLLYFGARGLLTHLIGQILQAEDHIPLTRL
jgi:hypothetical protein